MSHTQKILRSQLLMVQQTREIIFAHPPTLYNLPTPTYRRLMDSYSIHLGPLSLLLPGLILDSDFSMPDLGSKRNRNTEWTKNVSIFNLKNYYVSPDSRSRNPCTDFSFPDPVYRIQVSKKHWIPGRDPQHWLKGNKRSLSVSSKINNKIIEA